MSISEITTAFTPDEALAKLIAGNNRFLEGIDAPDSFKYQDQSMSQTQRPYACILGCADSRVSPEHTFDEGHGNLFVTRVAGNFVTQEILGSLEYGTSVLGASVILVLGHSGCGAINAAISSLSTQAKFEGQIDTLIGALTPTALETRHSNTEIWKKSAVSQNILKNVEILRRSEPVLKKLIDTGKLKVFGGVYHLDTGKVEILAG
jgi:carbonic anhydrase